MKISGTFLAVVIPLLFLNVHAGEAPEQTEPLILATTDLHCKFLPDDSGKRGLTKAAGLISDLRNSAGYSLLFDVGDAFEGSPEADFYALLDENTSHPLATAMNRMGYGAMAIGNHEFTYGLPFLKRMGREIDFPLLAANLESEDPFFSAYTTMGAGPFKILVIGVTTPWTAEAEAGSVEGHVQFSDQIKCLNNILPKLRKKHTPDLVCVLAHTGLGEENYVAGSENQGFALAERVSGIDLLFLGHTHTTVDTTIRGVTVLQAGSRGSHIAVARIALERKGKTWRIVDKSGEIVSTQNVDPDPELEKLFVEAMDPVDRWLNQEIGSFLEPTSTSFSYSRQDPITNLILNVMLQYGKGDVALVAPIRDNMTFDAGPIRRKDLYRIQPYLNRLVTVDLSGEDIARCLEQAASVWDEYPFDGSSPPPVAEGRQRDSFLVACGIDYVIDYTKNPGERLVSMELNGRSVGPTDTMTVVLTNYRRTGAGGYPWLRDAPEITISSNWLRAYLEEWLLTHPRYRPEIRNGWFSLPAYQGRWAQPVLDMLLQKSGSSTYSKLDWNWYASNEIALGLAEDILDQASSPELQQLLSDSWSITRGELLTTLVRNLPGIEAKPGEGAKRFADLPWSQVTTVWDSVVTSGLVAFLPGDSLKPELPVPSAELAVFLLNGRYRALTVVSSNDFHGHLEPSEKRGQGGAEALAAWLVSARKANPSGVVLLDAGDAMQGTPISNLFEGSSTISLYNSLRYDALVVGNHEFDWGQAVLKDRISQADFPFLGANVLADGTGEPVSWLDPFVTIRRGGAKVTVIGVSTAYTPWMTLKQCTEGLEFVSPIEVFEKWLPEKGEEDSDLIVLLGHLGLDRDNGEWTGEAGSLAEAAVGKVDIFFNGHTHSTYSLKFDELSVLQAGSYGRAISVVYARLDRLGIDKPWLRTEIVRLDPRDWKEPETAKIVEVYSKELAPKTQVVVVELGKPISRDSNPAGESKMGRLIAEAQRSMVGVEIALMNSGGVRGELYAGPVIWQELYQIQPFGNTLVKATLTGKELRQALEQGIHPTSTSVQVAGIRVLIDRSRSFGQRVRELLLEDGTPVKPSEEYAVVFNNFIGSGGDNYTILRDCKTKTDTGIMDLDALIDYLRRFPEPVELEIEERMRIDD